MKRLYRSKTDKMIGGVCGGIGETYGIDPTILRLAWVFIGLLTVIMPAVITYVVAWIIIPEKPEEQKPVVNV
jgi:phage shock protein C